MKTTIALLFLGFMAIKLPAEGSLPTALTVAVYDFKEEAEAGHNGGKVTALVTTDLTAQTNLVMLERSELDKAINEQAFGISGMVSSDAAARIGQITGVKVLVSGQVIKISNNRLAITASIIGTETGRLFAAKVEGTPDNLIDLTSDLSSKIAQTIGEQAGNLVAPAEESHAQCLDRIMAGIKGTNRPTVSVAVEFYSEDGGRWPDNWAEYEFGAVLIKAGFTVMDDHSDRKADIEIVGDASNSQGSSRGNFVTTHTAIEVKVQERRTGKIIAFDRQESAATGIGGNMASRASHVNAVDELAARVLPLLAK